MAQDFDGSQAEEKITTDLTNAMVSGGEWPKAWAYMGDGSSLWQEYVSGSYQSTEEHEYLSSIAPQLASMVLDGATIVDNGSGDFAKIEPLISSLDALQVQCNLVGYDIEQDALQRGIRRFAPSLQSVRLRGVWGTFEAGKQYLASAPAQRILITMGSTFSNDSGRFEDAAKSARSLLRSDNDFMVIGQDCHVDKDSLKVQAAFEHPKFVKFIEGAISRADARLGLPGPWTRRWRYRVEWRETPTYLCHVYVIEAVDDMQGEMGHIVKGTECDFFPSYRFHAESVMAMLEAAGLWVKAMQIKGGGSYIFLARPFPSLPKFPQGTRLATASDIPHMTKLSIAGSKDSEAFRYTRRNHEQYPEDTHDSLAHFYAGRLRSRDSLCLVSESGKGDLTGIICWDLPENSPRIGQFTVNHVGESVECLRRDEDPTRWTRFTDASGYMEKRFLSQMWKCNELVVHPKYQGMGIGQSLLRWSCLCADIDATDQGVISSQGARVYKEEGFLPVGVMTVEGDEYGDGFAQEVLVRRTPRPQV